MSGGLGPAQEGLIGDAEFRESFGEELASLLDLGTWDSGFDMERAVARFREEIAQAVGQEERVRAAIRARILPILHKRTGAPPESGVYRALPDELATVHSALLFTGRVEAVNGISVSHDSLPIGITQLGVSIVGYGGTSGTFSQRLFRKEMSARSMDAFQEALAVFRKRHERSGTGSRDNLSQLARRGIRTYAERAVLVDRAEAEWRIGRGNPCAEELLSGSGYAPLLEASLDMLRRLIHDHQKFVFVPDGLAERGYLTLGYALGAGEYAIIDTLEKDSLHLVDRWQYGGRCRDKALAFVRECGPDVLMGLFRASDRCPPQLFYAHRRHVHLAVRVALADSILRPERGFPLLLDVADVSCRGAFGSEGFLGLVHDAYSQSGANLQYFSERDTRR